MKIQIDDDGQYYLELGDGCISGYCDGTAEYYPDEYDAFKFKSGACVEIDQKILIKLLKAFYKKVKDDPELLELLNNG